jgi:hypothetical protein
MANIVIEFDIEVSCNKPQKFCKLIIKDCSDEFILGLSAGDEIGFDLVESNEFFYVTISRKVCIIGYKHPIYVICVPVANSKDESVQLIEKFRAQFGEKLTVEYEVSQ